MQKSVAVVLIIAAFLAGALADRVLRWATTPDAFAAAYVPAPAPGPVVRGGTADEPATWDMAGCMASAATRGMTQQESTHACQEIMK